MSGHSYIALCGGVGGSRLADGLARNLAADKLTIVVNTGDDFDHLGLRICPDIDTVTYMLAGLVDETRGWGRANESWAAMDTLAVLDGPTWFNLGDRDLALHLWRTHLLREGHSLSEVTHIIASQLGVRHIIAPISNNSIRTLLQTNDGELTFQDYFVRKRCEPAVTSIRYSGIQDASLNPEVRAAFADPNLRGIIIAPSNPFLSIGPMLAVPKLRDILQSRRVPCVAVSPLVGGKAVKGPLSKLLTELGYEQSAAGIISFYSDLIDGFILDERDQDIPIVGRRPRIFKADTLMQGRTNRSRMGQFTLDTIEALHAG
ncbi:MAG: 2-phospho-L-lactate transferase [Xanthobacteraceae bacterium]